ncbi:hypothetical protein BH24CHL8_BH24CHL8_10680 [soil metagenome]
MHRPELPPPGAHHLSHDRLLVVRLTSDDISRSERPAAEALVAACADCAALALDISLISRATASLPAARRPRDFRLSAEQAQRARGSLLRRLMERLSSPNLGILQPMGAAAVAIGFVLVVVGMGLPSMSGASPAGDAGEHYSAAQPSSASARETDMAAPAEGAPAIDTTDTSSAPAAGAELQPGGAEPPPRAAGRDGTDAPSPEDAPVVVTGGALDPAASPAEAEVRAGDADDRLARIERGSGLPAGAGLVTLGLLLGVTGLLVIILRVLAQRIGRDPAIR